MTIHIPRTFQMNLCIWQNTYKYPTNIAKNANIQSTFVQSAESQRLSFLSLRHVMAMNRRSQEAEHTEMSVLDRTHDHTGDLMLAWRRIDAFICVEKRMLKIKYCWLHIYCDWWLHWRLRTVNTVDWYILIYIAATHILWNVSCDPFQVYCAYSWDIVHIHWVWTWAATCQETAALRDYVENWRQSQNLLVERLLMEIVWACWACVEVVEVNRFC